MTQGIVGKISDLLLSYLIVFFFFFTILFDLFEAVKTEL